MNGVQQNLPILNIHPDLKVTLSGKSVLVSTKCGIELRFDGNSLRLMVPGRFKEKLTGICGDCNGKDDDYRLKNGTDVRSQPNKYSQIGESYLVIDDSDKPAAHEE